MITAASTARLILQLNEVDESDDLEAKEISGAEVGKSFYETVCALLNEPDLGGGTILLGIKREEGLFPSYSISGVSNPDKLASDIVSGCATIFNVPIRVDIKPERTGRKVVLRVDVHEAAKSQKPIYFKNQHLPRGAYRRVGPADVRCTDEDLAAFFQDKAQDSADGHIVKEASWHDLDQNAIAAYRKARAIAYNGATELTWPDAEMLKSLGAIKEIDGKIKITLAGLLLFGNQMALRRLIPTHRVDYLRVSSLGWAEDLDQPFESLEMRGPLILLISRIIAAVGDDLPKAFQMDSGVEGQRRETPVIPFRVIREAVVNALMHRSYKQNRPVQIVRYPNRIVIKNPGYSLKSQDRFDESGSLLRNPYVAEVLHETLFAETKGSGIKVMRQKMAQSGLAAPAFDSDRDADEFIATFLFHHFLDDNDVAWLSNFSTLQLSEDQMKALIFVREVGAINNARYRSLTGVDTLSASKSLRKLKVLELLTEEGAGAKTTYVPAPLFNKLANKDGPAVSSGFTMDGKAETLSIANASDLIKEMPEKLRKDVRTAQLSQRMRPDVALTLIVRMCKWKALSLSEIAGLLDKSAPHISTKYIQPLVAEGLLSYTIPEMVQHPRQKYKAST
ncbi:ATP-binding protein [Agrobacterium sp. 16-172Ci]